MPTCSLTVKTHAPVLVQPIQKAADFRIQHVEDSGCKVTALTPRASYWVHANFADHCSDGDGIIETNLTGANMVMSKARSAGFLMEYVGPNDISYL
ncbi:hypothetical protein E0H35_24025 [Rhizobium leguminosarum bv. viciae]|uniref:hypothetical protein n=1 Tax=Rhizobium TaxID=379 RepID=UPI00067EB43E|nr:hypothetical protein [Rhizobium leguminosarum]MBY5323759.1 hypothetical protein [Rhizobium leguminosarum]MBY5344435.1 hypothetical protein [Rhizobium leguminosarum]MBY5384726.1 hypothetical protein [Rhizobium leguminosarum]MBY5426454.1 hypothetical protein [Rhizobium leguminosarum]MCA2435473.1 hypothetical protein [Rhizobium leguminosarum]